ncbi:putative heterokaryon incompatibility [Septoria linicola]|nr:putative heterokaryon incompatibility [Septoria linicola]
MDQLCHEFQHGQLHEPTNQIRLLEISAVNRGDAEPTVHCQLSTWRVGQQPEYVAVSYTWGYSSDQQSISANTRPLRVYRNCYDVLIQIWDSGNRSYLWIDAICINQADDEEKSHQVAMMGFIYKTAWQVHVCLGPHSDASDELFGCMNHHSSCIGEILQGCVVDIEARRSQDSLRKLLRKYTTFEYLSHLSLQDINAAVKALRQLSERSYFRRLWMIQEFLLSQRAVLFCGTSSIDLRQLRCFYDDLTKYYRETKVQRQTAGKMHEIDMWFPTRNLVALLQNHNESA